jgi:pyrimidine operon attenuation protein/uracil phosphoribosyltransferase
MSSPIEVDVPVEDLDGKVVLVVDDVANTGRTLFYACKPLMEILPARLETAVLVDRKHKSFPIRVDYVGLSLATTLKENIDVQILEGEATVHLN